MSRTPKSDLASDAKTIESAWQLFSHAAALPAHRPSFVAGAAWALGRMRNHAEMLIRKEILPDVEGAE